MPQSERLLVLLRHGQSEWNLKNLFTGWKDPDLSPLGVEEAKEAGRRLKKRGLVFDIAFTSVLVRAQHTLALTLAELGQTGLPEVRDQALNERHYGDLCGLTRTTRARSGATSKSACGGAATTSNRPAARASRTRSRGRSPIIAKPSCPRCFAASASSFPLTATACARW